MHEVVHRADVSRAVDLVVAGWADQTTYNYQTLLAPVYEVTAVGVVASAEGFVYIT